MTLLWVLLLELLHEQHLKGTEIRTWFLKERYYCNIKVVS